MDGSGARHSQRTAAGQSSDEAAEPDADSADAGSRFVPAVARLRGIAAQAGEPDCLRAGLAAAVTQPRVASVQDAEHSSPAESAGAHCCRDAGHSPKRELAADCSAVLKRSGTSAAANDYFAADVARSETFAPVGCSAAVVKPDGHCSTRSRWPPACSLPAGLHALLRESSGFRAEASPPRPVGHGSTMQTGCDHRGPSAHAGPAPKWVRGDAPAQRLTALTWAAP